VEVYLVRDKKWRPRQGKKLAVECPAGWIERKAVEHIGKFPKIFLYGPVALILAWMLSTSGRGEIELKSWGALVLAVWLAIDLWHFLLLDKWCWRFVVGWTGSSLLLIGAMGFMWC
jgi:hypothetical protein